MPVKILQLTDLHLFSDPETRLRGVPTGETLTDVLDHVQTLAADCDWIVLTGDLAHDEQPSTYRQLRERLAARGLLDRCLLLPGNHDSRRGMRAAFPEQVDRCELLEAPAGGPATDDQRPVLFCIAAGGWHLYGLDSHIPGEVCGRVSDDVVSWLDESLGTHPGVPAAVFLHHPPVVIGSAWLDRLGLLDAERLTAVLRNAPQVRLICCGHIHQDWSTRLGNAEVMSSPSTCIQFSPGTAESSYDHLPPGARLLELGERDVRTRTLRLPELRHPPDAAD